MAVAPYRTLGAAVAVAGALWLLFAPDPALNARAALALAVAADRGTEPDYVDFESFEQSGSGERIDVRARVVLSDSQAGDVHGGRFLVEATLSVDGMRARVERLLVSPLVKPAPEARP